MAKIDTRKLPVESPGLLRQMVIRLCQQSGMAVKGLAAVVDIHRADGGKVVGERRAVGELQYGASGRD